LERRNAADINSLFDNSFLHLDRAIIIDLRYWIWSGTRCWELPKSCFSCAFSPQRFIYTISIFNNQDACKSKLVRKESPHGDLKLVARVSSSKAPMLSKLAATCLVIFFWNVIYLKRCVQFDSTTKVKAWLMKHPIHCNEFCSMVKYRNVTMIYGSLF
jgi:hypothetical protein